MGQALAARNSLPPFRTPALKFTIERADLLAAMSAVAPGVGNKNIATISNVLIATNSDTVSFRTTDLDQEITTRASADIVEPGTTTVPAATLFDIAKNMAQGSTATFTLDDADARAIVQSGRSRFKLPVINARDFPSVPDVSDGVSIVAPAGELAAMFERVSFCASVEDIRFHLTGICIFVHDNQVAAAATNGHRIALTTMRSNSTPPAVLLAPKFVAEMIRLLTGLDLMAELVVSPGRAKLICGDMVLIGKTLDAQPLDYVRAMDQANGEHVATIDVDALKSAMRRATIMATDKGRSVRAKFSAGSLVIAARAETSGEASDEIDIDYDGPEASLSIVGTDLADILSRIPTESVVIRLGDNKTPILITATGEAVTRYVVALLRG